MIYLLYFGNDSLDTCKENLVIISVYARFACLFENISVVFWNIITTESCDYFCICSLRSLKKFAFQ